MGGGILEKERGNVGAECRSAGNERAEKYEDVWIITLDIGALTTLYERPGEEKRLAGGKKVSRKGGRFLNFFVHIEGIEPLYIAQLIRGAVGFRPIKYT